MSVKTMASQVEQHDLLHLLHLREENAFAILYRKYWPSLLQFAGHFIADKDTCQEIVQQLFIQLHIKRPQLRTKTSLTAYLQRSLRNKILNHLRNTSRYYKHIQTACSETQPVNGSNHIDGIIDLAELQAEIAGALNNMPLKYREVYELHEHHQLTLKKTAEVLQRPPDTVEKQYRKAVHLLRHHLLRAEIALTGS